MGIQINGTNDTISSVGGDYVNVDDGIVIGNKSTAQRNAGVGTAIGAVIYNTTSNLLQVYTPTGWVAIGDQGTLQATGGTESTPGDGYKYHTFTSGPDTFQVTQAGPGSVEVLVLGGGGAGHRSSPTGSLGGGGAGGAGRLYYSNSFGVSISSYPVTIGAAGAANGGTGGSTTFGPITSPGGGGGGIGMQGPSAGVGAGGGSGGGGGWADPGAQDGGSATGDSGGIDNSNSPSNGWGNPGFKAPGYGGGGGGGAGDGGPTSTVGWNDPTDGAGLTYSISGSSVGYAGGGEPGNGRPEPELSTNGVAYGGGRRPGQTPRAGEVNKGGGGGGSVGPNSPGGNGGSGIVIIRYQVDE